MHNNSPVCEINGVLKVSEWRWGNVNTRLQMSIVRIASQLTPQK
jgi:hypothetical protein